MAQELARCGAALVLGAAVTACNLLFPSCGFSEETYARLRVGMTEEEVVQLAGCRGTRTTPVERKKNDRSQYRLWGGPRGSVTIELEDGRVAGWRVT